MRSGICALVALCLSACSLPTDTVSWAGLDALELRVELSRSEVVAGDTLSISVTAVNRGARPVLLPQSTCMPFTYRVYAADGREVTPPADLNCDGTVGQAQYVVASGSTAGHTQRWSAVNGAVAPGGPWPLPPGEYQVIGGIRGQPQAISAPVTLRVL